MQFIDSQNKPVANDGMQYYFFDKKIEKVNDLITCDIMTENNTLYLKWTKIATSDVTQITFFMFSGITHYKIIEANTPYNENDITQLIDHSYLFFQRYYNETYSENKMLGLIEDLTPKSKAKQLNKLIRILDQYELQ